MASLPVRAQVYGIAVIMLLGVVGEAVVLFFVDDSVLRLRVGMLLLAMIAWPLFYAARRFPAGDAVLAEHPRRRFGRLRRWTRELLREISRLNWTVVDVNRGFRDRAASKEEIAAIETRLFEIIQEIKDAAGHPDPREETGHEREIALRSSYRPRRTPDQQPDASGEPT